MTADRPTFDVVIPAHDAAATVVAAVRSALDQRLPARSVTVVADGCRDDTAALADAAGADVVISHRGTPGGARNVGAASGTAGWIAFLDADDLWRPGWLEAVATVVARSPEVGLCYGTVETADATGQPIRAPEPRRPSGDLYQRLLDDSFITTSAVVVRRSVFEQVGGFDERYHEVEDYDLWLRLAERHPFAAVHGQHVVYRRVPRSAMRTAGRQQRIRDQGLAIIAAAGQRRPLTAQQRAGAESHIYRASAERLLAGELVAAARGDLRAALERTPADGRLWAMALLSALPATWRQRLLALRRGSAATLADLVAMVRDDLSKKR